MKHPNIVIVGGGIAGLSSAIHLAERRPEWQVHVFSKLPLPNTNSMYAQGGIAVVTDFEADSFDKHIQDTLLAGDGVCVPEVVRLVITSAPDRLNELLALGAQFDKNVKGGFDLALEGGHTARRILHHQDITGQEMMRVLILKAQTCSNIIWHIGDRINQILVNDQKVTGVEVWWKENRSISIIPADAIFLATGGIGQLYHQTTNSAAATGDGLALGIEAGAETVNMEFIQFHPTVFMSSEPFLISEAVRGAGAILRNNLGYEFMKKIHPLADLAPRDVVAKAIYFEMQKERSSHVGLDVSGITQQVWETHFPHIYAVIKKAGIDPARDPIPVAPGAHYLCGGLKTDLDGCTQIQGLYAVGENAYTGLHGANRLASNSLLEALVFGFRAAVHASTEITPNKSLNAKSKYDFWEEGNDIQDDLEWLKKWMTQWVGIVRDHDGLLQAKELIESLQEKGKEIPENYKSQRQLNMMYKVALKIIEASLMRSENKGTFFNPSFDLKEKK